MGFTKRSDARVFSLPGWPESRTGAKYHAGTRNPWNRTIDQELRVKSAVKNGKSGDGLRKCLSGMVGLDQITNGGLPRGRPTLVCGGAGCGKTLLAVEFLVRGATQFDEPGVFMSFEETEKELKANVASLGFDLAGLVRRKKIVIDYVHIERSEVQESGEYDLEGLFEVGR